VIGLSPWSSRRNGRVIAETTPPATRLFREGRQETITFAPPGADA
jgi:hypothetical protein